MYVNVCASPQSKPHFPSNDYKFAFTLKFLFVDDDNDDGDSGDISR